MINYCVKCGSEKIIRAGYSKKGAQRYFCKECGRRFTEGSYYIPFNLTNRKIQCPVCKSYNLNKRDLTRGGQRFECRDCGKKFVPKEFQILKGYEKLKANKKDQNTIILYRRVGVSITELSKYLPYTTRVIRRFLTEKGLPTHSLRWQNHKKKEKLMKDKKLLDEILD